MTFFFLSARNLKNSKNSSMCLRRQSLEGGNWTPTIQSVCFLPISKANTLDFHTDSLDCSSHIKNLNQIYFDLRGKRKHFDEELEVKAMFLVFFCFFSTNPTQIIMLRNKHCVEIYEKVRSYMVCWFRPLACLRHLLLLKRRERRVLRD